VLRTVRKMALGLMAAVLAVGSTALSTPTASASLPPITETRFPLPTDAARPYRIVAGLDGDLWFTESDANQIGRITTDGQITEYPIPPQFADSQPRDITVGPDGALWFTQYTGDLIGRIDESGNVQEYLIPDEAAAASGIAAAPDGTIWFTESTVDFSQLGILYPNPGYTEEFPLAPGSVGPMFIAAGPDGAMWFTLEQSNQIGRVDPATRVVTYYDVPTLNALPWDISAGPDGAMWFTELGGHNVGRIAMDGTITEFPMPGSFGGITGITPAFDGTLWAVQPDQHEVDQLTTDGNVIRSVKAGTQANHITAGPDGNVWFTEISRNDIVRISSPRNGAASVISYDAGFVNPSVHASLGASVRWLFRGPNAAELVSKPAVVSSPTEAPGSVFAASTTYAGSYAYVDRLQRGKVGAFSVPADAPSSATTGAPFTVTWATATPPARTRFDVQVRTPGSTWTNWDYGVSTQQDQYVASSAGPYAFRARIRNTASGDHSGWSPPVTVQVSA
jgi:virginiamycin B lyase